MSRPVALTGAIRRVPDIDRKAELAQDEREARQAIAKGERAQRLIDDELLAEAFSAVESTLVGIWRNSQPGEDIKRDDAWRQIRLINGLKHALRQHVQTGSHASAKLAQIEQERKGLFGRF